jgi:hypothetical protein
MDEQVIGGQVAVGEAGAGETRRGVDQLAPQAGEFGGCGTGLGQARRAGAVLVADEFQQDLGPDDLDRVGDRDAGVVELHKRVELRVRPLPGDRLPAKARAVGDRPVDPALPGAAALEVAAVPVELPVRRVPVALGREQARPVGPGHAPADQVHVGFLAGLQYAEFVVDRRQVGDKPLGMRPGAALGRRGLIPGRPAVAFRQAIGGVAGALGLQSRPVTVALFVGGLVVAELAAFLTAAVDSGVVVGVRAVAHGWCSSGRMWSGQG